MWRNPQAAPLVAGDGGAQCRHAPSEALGSHGHRLGLGPLDPVDHPGRTRPAPLGQDPTADVTGWKALMDAGEPFDQTAADNMLDQITKYHSSYYIDHSQAPAPLLISSVHVEWDDESVHFERDKRSEFAGKS